MPRLLPYPQCMSSTRQPSDRILSIQRLLSHRSGSDVRCLPAISTDHVTPPTAVGSSPPDPTVIVDIGAGLTSDEYRPMSVKWLRHSAATCPRHSSSEVRLTDSPPYHKRCDMKPLAVSGFGFSAYAMSPPHHPTSLPPCRHVNPCARPSADLSCHFTIPVDQSDPATSPMTSVGPDPTYDIMLTSAKNVPKVQKTNYMVKFRVFSHFSHKILCCSCMWFSRPKSTNLQNPTRRPEERHFHSHPWPLPTPHQVFSAINPSRTCFICYVPRKSLEQRKLLNSPAEIHAPAPLTVVNSKTTSRALFYLHFHWKN